MTSGSKSDFRVHKTPPGYKRPPGQRCRGRARYNTLGPPGPKGLHPKTSRFEVGIHPTASGFQDERPSSLRVPGQKSIQPPGSRTKIDPASRFQDERSSRKARHKAILAFLVAYLRGKIAILHSREWPRINGRVQLVVPPSPFGMDTTAHRKQHVPEFYSGTKSQLGHWNHGYNYIHVTILIQTKPMPIEACLFWVPAPRFWVPTPGSGSMLPGLGPASGVSLDPRKRGKLTIPQPPRQGSIPRRPSSSTRRSKAGSGDYYQPDEVPFSLQHVYNSTYWLMPRSPAHQQGPSTLTEAPRHIMLTAAYRQAMCPLEPCAPKATCPLGHVPTRAPCSLGHVPPLGYPSPSGYVATDRST
ncbi:hypothetical protein F2Q69_00023032 [Brassica cretica]|uniref:Uncharacterized protein n=1 Tax=Brassica cretica TaxID=69181 RepID=A0A8S9PXB9_BRACR|nr:hypothetical protein F2Q69_00023032 [Brassica cretica]